MTVTYAPLADHAIPPANRAHTARLARAIAHDLHLPQVPRVVWVVRVGDPDLTDAQRRAMGDRRFEKDAPVYGWTTGWTMRDAVVHLVVPDAGQATLAHELRHVAQRVLGVGPSIHLGVEALERDAVSYSLRVAGSQPLPAWVSAARSATAAPAAGAQGARPAHAAGACPECRRIHVMIERHDSESRYARRGRTARALALRAVDAADCVACQAIEDALNRHEPEQLR